MKRQTHFTIILVTVLAIALACLGSTIVSAQPDRLPTAPGAAMHLTPAQWAALESANLLLLLDDEGDATTYLPLVLRR